MVENIAIPHEKLVKHRDAANTVVTIDSNEDEF